MLDFVRWAVQGRVILMQFSGVLTLEDLKQMDTQANILIQDALPPHIDAIFDVTDVTQFDSHLMNIRNLKTTSIKNPIINWYISVTPQPNPAVIFVATMLFKVLGSRYRGMNTIDEALTFLQAGSNYDLTRTDLAE